ncbi:unnamed protein product [Adineta steineri]|uniref:C3H1-type domain-containing protein n=1 Tax=Adineta steineri TaxID=433720 RepID=A0A819F9J5_9BILA|nr:unnamed protein product [Adineta steineri]
MSSCSSCNKPLTGKGEEVTTASGVMFHRTCLEQLLQSKPTTTDEFVDGEASSKSSNPCRYGGECPQINNKGHCTEYRHPSYCSDGGRCKNQQEEHLKQYRHLPLCSKSHKCIEYQKDDQEHCAKFRHFAPRCPYGNNCVDFHDKKHFDEFSHSYPTPCPRTPFDCPLYSALSESQNTRTLKASIHQHCLDFSHVCKGGRNCTDKTSLHWSKSIHIARKLCPYGEKCIRVTDEEHLNSFTHPNILDIRSLCPKGDDCEDRANAEHTTKFRHNITEETGVAPYYGLDKGINFAQNHRENYARVERYAAEHKWKSLPSGKIPNDILNWIRTVQPIHRCNAIIFESILLHGHVMSREYMERLKNPKFVAQSVLQHSRIRRIEAFKQMSSCEEDARQYVTALVCVEFEKNNFVSAMPKAADWLNSDTTTLPKDQTDIIAFYEEIINKKEIRLSGAISPQDMKALQAKTMDIARASIKLLTSPSGIGYAPDKILGTDKLVFSVLGPPQGHYYGDIIVIFKRDILHHPDANLSMQAATTYLSGNAYKLRPWLGVEPDTEAKKVEHYHATKLHAAIPGYEYAIAAELMALTSLKYELNSMDISLKQILDRWITVDSHQTVEAHLPQLIPLEYIDHVYMPKNLFDNLSVDARQAISAVFRKRISVAEQIVEPMVSGGPPLFVPKPKEKARAAYQDACIHTLLFRYKKYTSQLALNYLKGITMTIRPTKFEDPFLLPMTISQAFEHYRQVQSRPSTANITYIYWKALNGDMILSLSNQEISSTKKQPDLRSLICYVAPKPSLTDEHYYESTSYLATGNPIHHEMILNKKNYKAKSNIFYMGCNMNDFFTYCLEIHRGTGHVVLSHAGPNGIYNHNPIVCAFNRSELDLTTLDFIHVSAGSRRVPIRNLIVCFDRQPDLHPTFDREFRSNSKQ